MKILSICDGHNASVALSIDGEVVFAISEERLTREKNYFGWPKESLEYIHNNICSLQSVDRFVFYRENVSDYLGFLLPEHLTSNKSKKIWKATISRISLRCQKFLNIEIFLKLLKKYYANKLKVSAEKILFLNHHKSHAYAAFSEINLEQNWLHVVIDAEGDGLSTSVYKSNGSQLKLVASINRINSFGHFYSQITEFLGMKPNQHEFKVMGLEPYSDRESKGFKFCHEVFSNLISIKDGNIYFNVSPSSRKFKRYLLKYFTFQRFDNVAAAAQVVMEEKLIDFVSYWSEKTKISNISFSGGVSMNVKLMQRFYEKKIFNQIYVVPSSGDESCVIGCCNYANIINEIPTKPLVNLYLGVERDFKKEIMDCSKDYPEFSFQEYDNINNVISKLLAQGHVVARTFGKDEFGARALGNRSILADPRSTEVIDLINKQIKNRDFWMPFTPSIIYEKANDLIINPRLYSAFYMNITFNSSLLAQKLMPASLHPWDKTVRPQFVSKDSNPEYYDLLIHFEKATGVPGLLNTSFNLHGDPNVSSTKDALNALRASGLKYLQIDNFLIRKSK